MGLSCLAIWCLLHPYLGLFHDAGLYALQALAHRDPDFLSQDVFLRFGSQDRFTVWSPLYAAVSGPLGIEAAAALLTLLSQLALLAGAWTLARAVMPALPATLGLAVLLAVPGEYGAERIFTCLEGFLTPRLAAEALSLGALAAALRGRRAGAVLLVAGAALLHPIMAAAGIAALGWLALPRAGPRIALPLAAAAGVGLLLLGGIRGRLDPVWLALVARRSPYLFLAHWQLEDWARVAVGAATLLIGRLALGDARARAFATAALATTAAGLVLTALAVDGLHLVLFAQLQPWRWQWLGTAAAALLLPQIVHTLWRQPEAGGRTTALLLLSAWIFGANALALAAVAAAGAAAAGLRRLRPGEARLILWGACGLLAIAVAFRVASNLEFTDAYYADRSLPWWLRRSQSFARDGAAPLALIGLGCWLAGDAGRRRFAVPALTAVAATACAVLLPFAWQGWMHREFTRAQSAALESLRGRIPRGAEVFAPESPLFAWVLLDRPSYLSVIQTSGLLFSRPASVELERRAQALRDFVRPDVFMAWGAGGTSLQFSREQLTGVCRSGEFAFLLTAARLALPPIAVAAGAPGAAALRLYRCTSTPGV